MKCAHCLSPLTVKNGHDSKGEQRYKCKDCKRRFCQKGFFARFRHKPLDIIRTVELKLHRLTLRETARQIKKLIYVDITWMTVYRWCMKFIALLVLWASMFVMPNSPIVHIDEKFIKVRGSKDSFAYLFVALGTDNKVRAMYLANARTKASAKEFFKHVLRSANQTEIAVTDKCQIYVKSVNVLGRKVRHVTAHFKAVGVVHKRKLYKLSNNRIERFNSDIDLFLNSMRGLKSFRTANIWLMGFIVYHNWLKPSRVPWYKIPKQILYRRDIRRGAFLLIKASPVHVTESVLKTFEVILLAKTS